MKILNQHISGMYLWTIALLSALAAISAYTLRTIPLSLLLSVASAGAAEALITHFYMRRQAKVPYSGLITGLIIGSVAPINAPLLSAVAASALAVASKFLVKYKGSNILNPATAGLIIALPLFGLGDEWWAASSYGFHGMAITLAPILIILAYEARRVPAALTFVAVSVAASLLLGGPAATSAAGLAAILLGVNYLFAFVMLIEPKTSPNGIHAQIGYGAFAAISYPVLASFRFPYPLLIALLLANALYLAYRMRGKR